MAPNLVLKETAKIGGASHLRMVAPSSTAATLASLDAIGQTSRYRRGDTVITQDDDAEYVFKVTSGALRAVRLLPDGRRHVSDFLLPGDYFSVADGETYAQSVEAVSDAGVVRYRRAAFEALLDKEPRLARSFLSVMCKELASVQDRLLLLGRKSAMERLASFLVNMAKRDAAERNALDLPMNRGDVADYLGLTVETVSRLLTDLRGRRIIDLPSVNHVVFLKPDALEDISAGRRAA